MLASILGCLIKIYPCLFGFFSWQSLSFFTFYFGYAKGVLGRRGFPHGFFISKRIVKCLPFYPGV